MASPTPPAVVQLYDDLALDRQLERTAKEVAALRKACRARIAASVARLRADVTPKLTKKDYSCSCLVVDGVLWRDCKAAVERPNHGEPRPLYPYEEAEAKAKAERDAIAGKAGCQRIKGRET